MLIIAWLNGRGRLADGRRRLPGRAAIAGGRRKVIRPLGIIELLPRRYPSASRAGYSVVPCAGGTCRAGQRRAQTEDAENGPKTNRPCLCKRRRVLLRLHRRWLENTVTFSNT